MINQPNSEEIPVIGAPVEFTREDIVRHLLGVSILELYESGRCKHFSINDFCPQQFEVPAGTKIVGIGEMSPMALTQMMSLCKGSEYLSLDLLHPVDRKMEGKDFSITEMNIDAYEYFPKIASNTYFVYIDSAVLGLNIARRKDFALHSNLKLLLEGLPEGAIFGFEGFLDGMLDEFDGWEATTIDQFFRVRPGGLSHNPDSDAAKQRALGELTEKFYDRLSPFLRAAGSLALTNYLGQCCDRKEETPVEGVSEKLQQRIEELCQEAEENCATLEPVTAALEHFKSVLDRLKDTSRSPHYDSVYGVIKPLFE